VTVPEEETSSDCAGHWADWTSSLLSNVVAAEQKGKEKKKEKREDGGR
jgi:hypothetical protein